MRGARACAERSVLWHVPEELDSERLVVAMILAMSGVAGCHMRVGASKSSVSMSYEVRGGALDDL
ncbi:hypothetical protein HYDPIDRAFT_118765 [Hydnomerulius pinastri MD-312]|uniref:Uncharacterized protein n=1 Tax=Hydnomerulius pinastri MD-312 TaxID=994086 RepID=A0A0C9V1Y9_9AGAM|nr:hypothetical protein HYDPIDRAFT_118765 [Hydnomerulius pinastri MD-312]